MTTHNAPGANFPTAWSQPPGAVTDGTGGLLSADLVLQVANELFRDTPPEATAPVAQASVPAASGGPTAPLATGAPVPSDTPLDAASQLTPDIPAMGGGPLFPGDIGLPALDGLPTGIAPFSAGSSPFTPAGGDAAFAGNLPYQLDAGLSMALDSVILPAVGAGDVPAGWPSSEADLLGFGKEFLGAGAQPAPSDNGAAWYFLPAPPAATPERAVQFDAHSVRDDFPALHQQINGKPLIWLDNAATTQKPQVVIDTLAHFYAHDNSNIHRGSHTLADRATLAFEEAREKVQHFLGASSPAEIIFTRGTTESINLVAQTFGRAQVGTGDEVLVTTLEHHSNIVPWQLLCEEKGATLRVIPIDDRGEVLLDEYERLLNPRTRLVALAHVSNVLGTVLPISVMTHMAHRQGARVLVDGAQSAPHLPINVQALDADFFALSGHKLFAPTGIGVLYGKHELLEAMPPWQGGGNMIESVSFAQTTYSPLPAKFEAGTAHIAGAVGLGAAVDYLTRLGMETIAAYEEGLMTYAMAALATIPGLRQIGTAPGKVGALAFVIPGMHSEELGRFLDREGIAVRAGHHCAQPTLQRYGLTSAVRPSISLYNTAEEIDVLVDAIQKARSSL